MKRMDIIFSQSIDDDFMLMCKKNNIAQHFTKIPTVYGQGFSVPKMGDNIWPQVNTMYIVFCEETEVNQIKQVIDELREIYKGEGIACFTSDANVI